MPFFLQRPVAAVLLACALLCPRFLGQTASQPPGAQAQPGGHSQHPNDLDQNNLTKPDPKRAKRLAELGAKAETTGKYDQALGFYEEAARYAPFDVNLVAKAAGLRSKLVRQHVESGERFAIEGNLQAATLELAAALNIDPENSAVQERLQQLAAMNVDQSKTPTEEPPEGLAKLEPQKISKSFNLRTDVRSAFEQVASAYGIKAAFDPDLPSRTVHIRVDDVNFDSAISVLTAQSGTFWRALNPKLMFVAADTAEKRRAYEAEIEQTFVLPASVDSTEMSELVRTLRELTGAQRIQQSISAHTVSIRDSAQRVRLAGDIIHELERSRAEVLLEIDLLEVDRNLARNLGITPPANLKLYSVPSNLASQLRNAPSLTALLTLLTQIFGSAVNPGATSLAAALPPLAAIGGGRTTFLLGLPSVSANFSEALSLVHSGRQVLMRAQDGKPATFFVGDRVPITLSLLSGSLGSTSFTANPGGTATTIATQQFTVGQGPVALASADFRAIGAQDLAVLNQIDNSLTILLNQGTGAASQFAQATGSPISLGTPRASVPPVPPSLATGSLNSNTDSLPDLLVVDPDANTVTVLLATNAANGTFSNPATSTAYTVGREPSSIAVGTFNTQGGSNANNNVGFVVTNFEDNTYSVFTGNGDGTFAQVPGSPFALPATVSNPIAVTVNDFNNDSIPDLAILCQNGSGPGSVVLLQGNGDGTFRPFLNLSTPQTYATGKGSVAIASGSLSGSTGPALVIANQTDNTLTILFGNGDGTFVASSQSPLATDTKPSGVVIADFVQQGLGGIAVTNAGVNTVSVFADVGSGVLSSLLETAAGTNPGAIVAAPFTASTFPDVVVTNDLSGSAGQVTLIESPTSLISNPSISQQPYPGSQYEDIGLKIKTTPAVHANDEVTLQMDFDIKSLAGQNINGIPIITNRTLTQTVRLKENETSLIGGFLDQTETKTITGLPGFAELPGIGYAFGSHNASSSGTELLILITPRKLRIASHESRTIYAGRGDPSARGPVGVSAPVSQPTQVPEQPPAGARPENPPQPPPNQPAPAPGQPVPQPNPQTQPPPPQPEPPNP